MKNILITGGTGLIGSQLTKILIQKGYSISILSRSSKTIPNVKSYIWNVRKQEIDETAIKNADFIIHLAGSNIGDKNWNTAVKKEIIKSREDSTELLFQYIKKHNPKLKAFISTSAVGYYGTEETEETEEIFTEKDNLGIDFLAEVCNKWEKNVPKIKNLGIRTCIIRTGVVLSEKGGALEQMVLPVKLGLGSALGNGKQYIPWIHINDICALYLKAIEEEKFEGIFNGVGIQHINNHEFTKTLAKVLNKPFFLPNIPAFVLKAILGERAVIALKGNKVSAEKIIDNGFKHEFINLESALNNLLKH